MTLARRKLEKSGGRTGEMKTGELGGRREGR